ncbi:hypothetical protein FHR24_001991 [Wenyingzhuangia heitensis]|uniref:TonB-dependent Receptor Plug Domain n=1 Tax=Wenyingzhuangia heitensis TaxID=1487859 RepID=A0ABX0U9L4_9FLAO|nr:hypothetical protein [Wenyingzhuangia heitensis]NIJ45523.1 hypothetical protein [Wenyingzhuangia heitensis]
MKKILLISITFCLASFTIITTTDFLDKVQQKLGNYTKNHPEKIYIQTDKPFYSTDEDLWFSTYLVNGITHQKTDKSKVVHVELINAKDSIVSKRKLFFNNTIASGDFKINKNWKPGTYILRAYTKYMQNQSSDYFFQKEIPIYNIEEQDNLATVTKEVTPTPTPVQQAKETVKPTRPNIRFYPEGGNLIAETANKIAFEVKDKRFSQVNLNGTIKDQNHNEIVEFKTLELGLGSFIFIPELNKNYYASVFINGKEEKYFLPKILPTGYTLGATNNGQHIIIQNSSTTETGLKDTYLVAHQRGHLLYKNFETENKTSNVIKIATKELADGVVNITLFNAKGNPVAERLIFIDNPDNNLTLNINAPEASVEARKKITIQLDVKNTDNKSVAGNLSMAVRDLKAYPYNTRSGNIKSWLLLNSDLRGSVKNPGYFFEKENDLKRRYLLDLLLMTHGWRRFTWTDLLTKQDTITPKFKPETGLFIAGTTKQLKKPYQAFAAPTRLTFFTKNIFQEPIRQSDTLGKFKFGPYVFFDSMPVIIESRMEDFKSTRRKSRNVVILVDKDRSTPKIEKNVFFNKIEKEDKELEVANFVKVTKYIKEEKFRYNKEVEKLNEITLIAKRKTEEQQRQEDMNNLTDYGEPMNGERLDLLNDFNSPGSYTAFDIVSQMNGVFTTGDSIYLRRSSNPAKIVLDNLEIDGSFLQSINGDEISFIDVLQGSDAATFSNGGNGVIALYSNTGNVGSRNIKRKPGIIDFQAEGFYTARKFYAPDHVNDFELLNKSDLRTTLHWEPIIRTNNNGATEVSFYTSDIRSDYIIEVEGISDNGTPIHGIKTFNVE